VFSLSNALKELWNKASRLVASPNTVVHPPGPTMKDRLVLSESSSVPHYVSVKSSPSCSYRCDQNCQNFSAMQICSHVVAAAEVNGELALYINSFKKAKGKQPANMTRVAKRGLPAGSGRKGRNPLRSHPARNPPVMAIVCHFHLRVKYLFHLRVKYHFHL